MEKWNSIFFFGTNKGSVCLADDLKHCSEVCKVGKKTISSNLDQEGILKAYYFMKKKIV
jgi:hypothetical protein